MIELLNLLATSLILLIVLIAGLGMIFLGAVFVIAICCKISDWSDDHGSWVEWIAMLVLLWLFAFAISCALRY